MVSQRRRQLREVQSLTVEVGPQSQHHQGLRAGGEGRQRGQEGRALRLALADGEQLLQLVDHQHQPLGGLFRQYAADQRRRRTRVRTQGFGSGDAVRVQRGGQALQRVRPGREQHAGPAGRAG